MLLQSIGPMPPAGTPQLVSHRGYVHIHIPGGGLSHGGLIAANGGEDKVNREPRLLPEH